MCLGKCLNQVRNMKKYSTFDRKQRYLTHVLRAKVDYCVVRSLFEYFSIFLYSSISYFTINEWLPSTNEILHQLKRAWHKYFRRLFKVSCLLLFLRILFFKSVLLILLNFYFLTIPIIRKLNHIYIKKTPPTYQSYLNNSEWLITGIHAL